MTNLCGHDRGVLIWAIEYARDMWRDDATVLHNLQSVEWRPKNPSRFDAMSAIIDPAKLAEMLAARGRELGWNTYGDDVYDMPVFPCIDFTVDEGVITIDVWCSMHDLESGKNEQRLGMPQARAILLQWLQLPDGAREEAERGFTW